MDMICWVLVCLMLFGLLGTVLLSAAGVGGTDPLGSGQLQDVLVKY